uniref:Uncharacterized protein n=1 Tax=uncultured Thiotrichaceae bacterium TaxID=298394 RepID=A0A6S6TD79_9GAMM|nr:MAG: Unknown protein [uncultured Thiotrichaceae bacterium]
MYKSKLLTSGAICILLGYTSTTHAGQSPLFGDVFDAKQQFEIAIEQLENSNLSTKEFKKGFRWLKLAAANQHPAAQYKLGFYHHMGIDGIEGNYQKATKLYRSAARKGHLTAQFQLSSLLLNENLPTYDFKEGLYWLTRAAQQNDIASQYSLALLYRDKKPATQENHYNYLEWLTRSAENGYRKAQYALGSYYIENNKQTFNLDKAFNWFHEAAKQGDAHSQYNLALIYEQRGSGQEHQEHAVYWFRKASEQKMPDATFNLGRRYLFGHNVEQNTEKGLTLVRKAAKNGNPAAQTLLGSYHIQGQLLEQNYDKAMQLYKTAAKHPYPEAQYQLALMFARGQGVKKSEKQAVHWISKAAELDHPMAQYGLGAYLINGVGIEQNMFLAAYWISLAAAQGQEHAIKARESVLNNLNAQEIKTLKSKLLHKIGPPVFIK